MKKKWTCRICEKKMDNVGDVIVHLLRKHLAEVINCIPSQIWEDIANLVMTKHLVFWKMVIRKNV